MNIRLRLSYDGTGYFGWQDVGVGPTIEKALREVLESILQEKVSLQAASRTDRGVHAKGQVVNYFSSTPRDLNRLLRSLNALLPKDIRVTTILEAPDNFHPTLDAIGKVYHYDLCTTKEQMPQIRLYSWHWPHPLNLSAMKTAASDFIGTHHFGAFCNTKDNFEYSSYERVVEEITIEQIDDSRLRFRIKGNHFLYKMVRNIVGTLVYVGAGKIAPEAVAKILASKDRTQAGITAPAHGLTLYRVNYPLQKTPPR